MQDSVSIFKGRWCLLTWYIPGCSKSVIDVVLLLMMCNPHMHYAQWRCWSRTNSPIGSAQLLLEILVILKGTRRTRCSWRSSRGTDDYVLPDSAESIVHKDLVKHNHPLPWEPSQKVNLTTCLRQTIDRVTTLVPVMSIRNKLNSREWAASKRPWSTAYQNSLGSSPRPASSLTEEAMPSFPSTYEQLYRDAQDTQATGSFHKVADGTS